MEKYIQRQAKNSSISHDKKICRCNDDVKLNLILKLKYTIVWNNMRDWEWWVPSSKINLLYNKNNFSLIFVNIFRINAEAPNLATIWNKVLRDIALSFYHDHQHRITFEYNFFLGMSLLHTQLTTTCDDIFKKGYFVAFYSPELYP